MEWVVKYAKLEDEERWFLFASKLKEDFCNIDLGKDEKYRSGMMKNIGRGTAIYVEDNSMLGNPIIGAITYSPNQNHISWLGVDPNYRRKGIATALMKQMLSDLQNANEIKVKTFLYDDKYGKAARSFYKRNGFIAGKIEKENKDYPHPVQEFVRNNNII